MKKILFLLLLFVYIFLLFEISFCDEIDDYLDYQMKKQLARNQEPWPAWATVLTVILVLGGIIGAFIWEHDKRKKGKIHPFWKECPDCKKQIKFEAKVCPYCHRKFDIKD